MFTIKSIYACVHDTSYDGYPFKVIVKVTMPVAEWTKYRKSGNLGQLYGLEISNAVYRVNDAICASNPMVDDRQRAKQGVKTLTLTYFDRDFSRAAKLGLEVKTHGSEQYLGFGTYVSIMKEN